MNPQSQDFEPLCRLLKLKRYEQPPPGYFHRFSGQVIARIRQGETAREPDFFERLLWDSPWLHRIFSAFETKPVVAGALGVAMCGLLISGVIYSEKGDAQPVALIPAIEASPAPAEATMLMAHSHPLLEKPAITEASSTSPVAPGLAPDNLMFSGLQAQPASFTFPGRN